MRIVDTVGMSHTIHSSIRGYVGAGDHRLIAGFTLAGGVARRVLIRAAGPALATYFGMVGVLAQPRITLFDQSGHPLRTASAWSEEPLAGEIRAALTDARAFLFGEGSNDAAMIEILPPGDYAVQVSGDNDTTGITLVEVYDLS